MRTYLEIANIVHMITYRNLNVINRTTHLNGIYNANTIIIILYYYYNIMFV